MVLYILLKYGEVLFFKKLNHLTDKFYFYEVNSNTKEYLEFCKIAYVKHWIFLMK